MTVKVETEALREEVAPTIKHATAPRPITMSLPVHPDGYQVRLTSAQFLLLADQVEAAAEERRRLLEQFQVDSIGHHPDDEITPVHADPGLPVVNDGEQLVDENGQPITG